LKKNLIFFILYLAFFKTSAQKKGDYAVEQSYKTEHVVFEKKPSIISIPFDISIDDIQKQINQNMPDLIYEDKSFEDNNNDEFKVKVWRKGNLEFTGIQNNVLSYEVPLKIWAQKRISAFGVSQAPDTQFEIKLRFSSKFFVNNDYAIQTSTNSTGFEWITKPVMKAGFLEIPVAPIIGKLIANNQTMFANQIDQAINSSFSLKPYILEAWNTTRKPFIASEEYNTWVKIEPQEVFLTPFKTNGKSLKATVGIKIVAETLVGVIDQQFEETKSIPKLKIVESIPEIFELSLYNVITYAEATKISKSMLVGEKFEFKKGKYKIELTDMDIYGADENLVLKITTKGSFKGDIYVKGIPYYDQDKKMVLLKNTDLDIKTKNFLHKAGAWLLEGTLEKKIEQDFGLPVEDIITAAKESTLKALNTEVTKGVMMKAEILTIEPKEIFVNPLGLLAVVNTKAKVELNVKGL
jgi:hypothetical protein